MPSALPGGTSKSTYASPSSVSPNSGAGAWQRTRLPHGHVASTTPSFSFHENFVPCRPGATRAMRFFSASRSGTTKPIVPRTTCGCGPLVGLRHVDVLEQHDVADVLGGPVEMLGFCVHVDLLAALYMVSGVPHPGG